MTQRCEEPAHVQLLYLYNTNASRVNLTHNRWQFLLPTYLIVSCNIFVSFSRIVFLFLIAPMFSQVYSNAIYCHMGFLVQFNCEIGIVPLTCDKVCSLNLLCWLKANLTLWNNLQWNLNQNGKLFPQEHTFKMSSSKLQSYSFRDQYILVNSWNSQANSFE